MTLPEKERHLPHDIKTDSTRNGNELSGIDLIKVPKVLSAVDCYCRKCLLQLRFPHVEIACEVSGYRCSSTRGTSSCAAWYFRPAETSNAVYAAGALLTDYLAGVTLVALHLHMCCEHSMLLSSSNFLQTSCRIRSPKQQSSH